MAHNAPLTAPVYVRIMRAVVSILLALVCVLTLTSGAEGRGERIPWLTFNEVSLNGERRVLSRHNVFPIASALSPDQRQFAYTQYTCDGCAPSRRLWISEVRSPRDRVLLDMPTGIREVAWAPNGRTLALSLYENPDARGLWLADSDGAHLRRVADFGSSLAWSPDSKLLAFNVASHVGVISVESGDMRFSIPGSGPEWSPNGKYIAFTSGTHADPSVSIALVETGDARVLSSGSGPLWSPSGKHIAYRRAPGQVGCRSEVHVVAVATGRKRSIGCGAPWSWSPDGRRIAFTRFAYGTIPLWVAPSQGGRARRLTDDVQHPLWSPDSKWIAFRRDSQYCRSTLAIVQVRTGRTRRIAVRGRLVTPLSWSAKSRRLLYTGMRCSGQ